MCIVEQTMQVIIVTHVQCCQVHRERMVGGEIPKPTFAISIYAMHDKFFFLEDIFNFTKEQ